MKRNAEHVTFDVLNDYADGRLDAQANKLVENHLADCTECSTELRSLRMLLDDTKGLAVSVLPEGDIWVDIRQEIEQRKNVVLRRAPIEPERGGEASARGFTTRTRIWLAAAAVVLVVLSSATTALVLRSGGEGPAIAESWRNPDDMFAGGARTLPVSFRITEGRFTATIEELRRAVDAQRSQLSPETVRTVDHSLAVVDSAIAEAREALVADPNNRMLVDLLSASYQRKLDLLRRTTELSSRI